MSHSTRIPAPADMSILTASILPELRALSRDSARVAALGRRLEDRVRRSVEAHRDLTTVRREDGVWSADAPGLMRRVLQESGGMRVQLLKVDAHAGVPWSPGAKAEEVLVIEGSLQIGSGASSTSLSQHQLLVVDQASDVTLRGGPEGAQVYVRCRMVDLEDLPAAEAQWWRKAQRASASAWLEPRDWSPFLEGCDAVDLQTHGGVASMLLRIAPGVQLPDHGHALDEDCFMLEGDMFLGDVLMRAGDYQLACAGGQHVGVMSDEGGLFYFHGAVPGDGFEEAM